MLASFILFFLLPLIIIILLYILILRGVHRSVKFAQQLHPIENQIPSPLTRDGDFPMEKLRKQSGVMIRRGKSVIFHTGQDKRTARRQQELCQIQQAQHQARYRTNKSLIRILGTLKLNFKMTNHVNLTVSTSQLKLIEDKSIYLHQFLFVQFINFKLMLYTGFYNLIWLIILHQTISLQFLWINSSENYKRL